MDISEVDPGFLKGEGCEWFCQQYNRGEAVLVRCTLNRNP